MRKFTVFSGFRGSGKTTAMMALTRFAPRIAMISNDLGEGVTLADHRLAALSGCRASEITDECICFCHGVLTERLGRYFDEGCERVVSDIPGFGVGALEHVYHGLTAECPGAFELGPFTVLTEPRNVERLQKGGDSMDAILDAQLREADLIVLNKCDLLTPPEREAALAYLRERYPEARALALSALTGEGLAELCRALTEGSASLRHPAIDYDGDQLQDAMGSLSEYYLQYHAAVCCLDFDGTAYLLDMAERARQAFLAAGYEIPHLKLLAWDAEGDYAKVDLIGTDRPMEFTRRFTKPCRDIAVLLNASAVCPADRLEEIVAGAAEAVSEKYQLELTVFKSESMGMG